MRREYFTIFKIRNYLDYFYKRENYSHYIYIYKSLYLKERFFFLIRYTIYFIKYLFKGWIKIWLRA